MADKRVRTWRTTMKGRLTVTAAVVVIWSAAIESRLVYLQVIKHAELTARAERQQSRRRELPAKRGEILDRRGHVLARSVDAPTIYAVPSEITDAAHTADALCGALTDCTPADRLDLREKLARRNKDFTYVRRQASPDQAQRVGALKLTSVGFISESKRFYPNKDLAAHLLGYVGIDHEGLDGIEHTYDTLIKGRTGTVIVQTDARRSAFSNRIEKAPTVGATLELTIDEYLQYVVERELRAGVLGNRAASGSAVVMDPWSGEILALANYPTFNPNARQRASAETRRNRAVQDIYEPGSTFKIVTASAALEQDLIDPGDLIDVSGGKIAFGTDVIHDTRDYHVLSFEDVIIKSSNVGAIKVALKLGPKRLTDYVRRFGFGRPSSPRDFPAETPGIVWDPSDLKDSALARVSIGYQVGVNPLQMAAAVSSIANGGDLLQPRVVQAVIKDRTRRVVPKTVVNRTVTPGVAAELTAIMEGVVARGTATSAQIPGYTIAGKTGTSTKWVDGRYVKSEHNASFVGFVPSRKPVYTIVVVIDSPHGANGYYGGAVAAPIFKRIAEAALRYGGVPPTLNAFPPLLVKRQPERTYEHPASGPVRPPPMAVSSITDGADGLFPDVTGLSAREALNALSRLGVEARMLGSGLVLEQQPAAGTPVESGINVTLWLGRQPSVVRTSSSATQ